MTDLNRNKLKALTLSTVFSLAVTGTGTVQASEQDHSLLGDYGLAGFPHCTDNKGKKVTFVGQSNSVFKKRHTGLAYAFRFRGKPIVHYDMDTLPKTPPEFQNHVFAHECGHHLLGHFDRAGSSNSTIRDREENEADCYALQVLGYGRKEAEIIARTLDELYPFDPNKPINITVPDIRPSLNRCLAQQAP